MTLHQFMLMGLIVIAIGTVAIILDAIFLRNVDKKWQPRRLAILTVACIFDLVGVVLCIIYACINGAALKHGAYGDYANRMTLTEILDENNNSFIDDSENLPEDLKGHIIVYYRYGCPDCHATYMDTYMMLYTVPDVHYVSTRSEKGKALLEEYVTDAVPSAVYVKQDGSYVVKLLYRTINDEPVFVPENLETLLDLQKSEKEASKQ